QTLGRTADADALLQRITNLSVGPRTTSAEYARIGRAARALGGSNMQLANDAYRLAVEHGGNDPTFETGWGELFLQAHDDAHAMESFQNALKMDPKFAPALLGVAQALEDENPPAAAKAAQEVL